MEPTPTESPASGRRIWLRRALTFLTAGLLCAATMEVIARQVLCGLFKSYDPALGRAVLKPGRVRYAKEGSGIGHWGAHGIRQPSALQPGNILCIGDSFTEALQVDDDVVFTRQLAVELAEECRPGSPPLDVLNVGLSGFALADHIGYAPNYRKFFDPAWVVVQIGDNDLALSENTRDTNCAMEFLSEGDIRIVAPEVQQRRTSRLEPIGRIIALAPFCYARYRELSAEARRAAATPMFRAASVSASRKADAPRTVPIEPVLKELVEAYDGRLTVLYLAKFDLAHPDERTPTETAAVAFLDSIGASVVTTSRLNPELSRLHRSIYGFNNGKFGQGHMNAYGHSRVSELLREELESRPEIAARLKPAPMTPGAEPDESPLR
jgi:hypothetical protein